MRFPPRGNEVPDLWCLREQMADAFLQHAVSVGHAFVLAQMFQPGLAQKVSRNRRVSAESSNTPHS